MQRGIVPITTALELEYRYYDKDPSYPYFNRYFEIYLIERTPHGRSYMLHMDNCDTRDGKWAPHLHKANNVAKKLYFGITTVNWNEIKENFTSCLIAELGEDHKKPVKKAMAQLASPKL